MVYVAEKSVLAAKGKYDCGFVRQQPMSSMTDDVANRKRGDGKYRIRRILSSIGMVEL